ncbi:succinylglutamate desuccinylase/aspartoacylase family protein [Halobium salinum]|uniref:Succinylglutamate desuccinylase/aspartoacylase family protein n=1 Tax=Halobium salinum TaxID=1364940 RepID=A0ABD5PBF5_9EURY|nr:succinylglutamate desuccinylase/aspartoacylase family protein [Halobium salinum]
MTGDDRSSAGATTGRRGFLKATAALGAGVAGLGSTGTAAAETRDSYTVLHGTEHETTVHYYDSGVEGPTTMVVGGVHGDERAGYRAADEIAKWEVEAGELVVLPRANVAAIADGARPWGDDDLNRQFPPNGADCRSELAHTVWKVVRHHDPDWLFDLHSSRGIYGSGDGGVGQAMFPTWTDPSRSTGENVVRDLNDHFDLSGDMRYRMGNTLDADEPMLVHRVAGVLDRPAFICETTEKADTVEEQVDWHLYSVEHAMRQYGQPRRNESDWSVGSGSDGSGSGSGATTTHGMAVVGTGNETEYAFTVSGGITPGDNVESDTGVENGRAHGSVEWRSDSFEYTGDMETFTVLSGDTNVDIWIDGSKYAASDFPDESSGSGGEESGMAVVGTGDETEYAFTVSGGIVPGDNVESDTEVENGRAHGFVEWRSDSFRFTGEMETFTVLGGDETVDIWIEGSKYAASDFPDESSGSSASATPLHASTVTVDHTWDRYGLDADLSDPVVVADAVSYDSGHPCHARLDDVGGSGFDCRVEEWDYLNGWHPAEAVGSVALDAGSHDIGGLHAAAGRLSVTDGWGWVGLDGFSTAPVVLTTVQTENDGQPVVARTRGPWDNGFDVRLQEEEGLGGHGEETVGYLAVEPGTGSVDGRAVEAGTARANHEWTRVDFETDFADPVFVGGVQSYHSDDPCALRYRNLTGSSVEVLVEEEQSDNSETWHATEDVGYLVVEGGN